MRHMNFVRIALKHARKSQHNFQLAALLVKSGRILSVGFNSTKTSPCLLKLHKPRPINKLHAEQCALNRCGLEETQGASLYIARISKSRKEGGMAKPCSMCMELIRRAGIKKIYYTTDEGDIICERIYAQPN